MKTRPDIFGRLLAIMLPLAAAGSSPLFAAPAAPPAKLEMPQSVFVTPVKPQEGRDPFFPNSTRPYDDNPDKITSGPTLTDLVFKGIVGTGSSALAIINNHTFAAGDEGDIITKTGQRLTIHCISIDSKANSVSVEANGSSAVLTMADSPQTP